MSTPGWPLRPAAVALDALEDHERAIAERLLAEDPTFRAEVDRLRVATAALGDLDRTAWEPVPPPPLGDVGPQARATGPAAALRAVGRRRGARGPRRLVPALAATAVLAAVVAVVLAVGGGDGGPARPPETTLALRALPGVPGRASLTIAGAEASLRGSGLPPSGAHDYYEAWLADARGRMVSMGTFRVGGDGRLDVHMAVAVDVSRYALVDVSLEPDDGDPGHSKTSVLRARL
jgi:anti-sigma-K factor RskA